MRKFFAVLSVLLTIALVYILDKPLGPLPALGRLLDPVNGFWANAESVNRDFSDDVHIKGLKQPVAVSFDERLVPHIKASNDHDIYFTQGYIHACFRLWQMDMQTRAAAGRISEVIGDKGLKFDREQRRKGMVFGAEHSLKAMEAEPRTKQMLDAYTAGINHYIASLNYRYYPFEYKLMGFAPEPWTNLKSALLLKYMADDLTGETEDIARTVMRSLYSADELSCMFPDIKGITPVIPAGTVFDKPSMTAPVPPADSNISIYLGETDFDIKGESGKGSNNWVLSGSRTKSGAAILCNDPHLGLNLPSLWYEVQLQAPGLNVYGVSLPGAPGVIIGFNENISWGFTNNYRDVKDFYAIRPSVDNTTYLFEGQQLPFQIRLEKIGIKGKPDFTDTVRYTLHGPILYDNNFHGPGGLKKPLALCWMAHRGTNELLSVYLLNRSGNYNEFVTAIQQFQCPAQNMAYADRQGNIALWGQGQFVNKWKGQGVYVMNGIDSSTLWQELIPMSENPHVLNPAQGFVSSANQTVTDTTYPYWYNGIFHQYRAWRINNVLACTRQATVQDMFALQNDYYSVLAEKILPVIIKHVKASRLSEKEQQYLQMLETWKYRMDAKSKPATVFQVLWSSTCAVFSQDKFHGVYNDVSLRSERVMSVILDEDDSLRNNPSACSGNIQANLQRAFKNAVDSLEKLDKNSMEWYHVKNTSVRHLTRIPALGYTDIETGGWSNTVNAMKGTHGPSWRMVVEMGKEINAYGIYPGGQSGNPGSKYYADFLDQWTKGTYNKLLFLSATGQSGGNAIKYTINMQPG